MWMKVIKYQEVKFCFVPFVSGLIKIYLIRRIWNISKIREIYKIYKIFFITLKL